MIQPDTSLGQHWLRDPATLHAIAAEAHITASDVVLEIGPGLGTLTVVLAHQAQQVVALELDKRLSRWLLQEAQLPTNVTVIEGDILRYNLLQLPTGYKVVANVPYYITSKIVRLLLESPNPPQSTTLLVQKEVAERLAAQPGDMSMLSVLAQFYTTVQLGPEVPAELFTPPPKVDSQVVTLHQRPAVLFSDITAHDFFAVAKAGFSEKRKQLANSLSGGLRLEKSVVRELLQTAGISAQTRAEQLDLATWHRLALAVYQLNR